MFSFSNLATIAESATGYRGGPYVDELPGMPLAEAVSYLPVVCLECQNELIDFTRSTNAALAEAAYSKVSYGRNIDVTALAEGALDGIKAKVDKAFATIKKTIQSIIAKLKQRIDTIAKSGQDLWNKYQDSDLLDRQFKDISIEGYPFPGDSGLESGRIGVKDMMDSAFPEFKNPGAFVAKATSEYDNASKEYTKFKSMSQADKEQKLANALSGLKLGKDWRNDVVKALYGTKKSIKVGEGMFTKQGVGAVLGSYAEKLNECKTQYENVEKEINDMHADMKTTLDELTDSRDSAKDADKEGARAKGLSLAVEYSTMYLSIVQSSINVLTAIRGIVVKMYEARAAQAKTMLAKMITWKAPKKNESIYDDDAAIFDFEM